LLITATGSVATTHTINVSGFTYSPGTLTAAVGDQVTFNINANHPTVEVDQTTWNMNGTASLPGGFGLHSSTFTITLSTVGDIYYVCTNHVSSGMKGKITVIPTSINEVDPLTGIYLSPSLIKRGSEVRLINTNPYRQDITLLVYNLLGAVVYTTETGQAEVQAFTFNLPVGTYFYKLKSNVAATKGKRIMIVD
jgi:plastocyanin